MLRIHIPQTVPPLKRADWLANFKLATQRTGRLMMLAGDQKIEHLNNDFVGAGIAPDDGSPEHLFQIASQARVGALAAQLGLIAAWGDSYRRVPYIIKLNSKTALIPASQADPTSGLLTTIAQAADFKKSSHLKVVGVGLTIYPGAASEAAQLSTAGQVITEARQHGLLTVLWAYPRGRAIKDETDARLIAGMTGLAASLGADFVKVNYPRHADKDNLAAIIAAAGRTGVIFSGGKLLDPKAFLKLLALQIASGARGNATGRNLHQRPLAESVRLAQAISAISLNNASAEEAYKIFTNRAGSAKAWRFKRLR